MNEPGPRPLPIELLRSLIGQVRRRFPWPVRPTDKAGDRPPKHPTEPQEPEDEQIGAERYRAQIRVVRNADRKSTRLNSSHVSESRMPSSA